MASVNLVIIIGNLGGDPEIKYLPSGTAITTFSIATTDKWKGKDGNSQEKTEWHNITAFGKLGEVCAEWLKKGSSAFIQGKLSTDKWDKDGVTHYRTKIIAEKVQFLDRKREDGQPQEVVNDSDIPF